ncbi:MAG: hypothetical protein M0Z67_11200, partial [Nitrospiraceae bacterium]|nr:hypothetical protein [Nitrospiraceae bacterium]
IVLFPSCPRFSVGHPCFLKNGFPPKDCGNDDGLNTHTLCNVRDNANLTFKQIFTKPGRNAEKWLVATPYRPVKRPASLFLKAHCV